MNITNKAKQNITKRFLEGLDKFVGNDFNHYTFSLEKTDDGLLNEIRDLKNIENRHEFLDA